MERRTTSQQISPRTNIRNTIVLIVMTQGDEDVDVDTLVDMDADVDADADIIATQASSKCSCPLGNYVRSVKKKTTPPTLERSW